MDPYYSRNEVSNSDLSWLKNQLFPQMMPDSKDAYRFGNLVDAIITEPYRVDYFKRSLDGEVFSVEEFTKAENMKKAFWNDDFSKMIAEKADGQKKMTALRKM